MSDRYPEFPPAAPSVTEIIEAVGLVDTRYFTEEARDRGSAVHTCCDLLANGILDWSSVDERIIGYVRSYERFLDEVGWKILATEGKLFHPQYLYVGTYDILFDNAVCDLKTGVKAKWHELQTSAYQQLAIVNGSRAAKRYTIYLDAEGMLPKLCEHKNRDDWAKFLACRTVFDLLEGR